MRRLIATYSTFRGSGSFVQDMLGSGNDCVGAEPEAEHHLARGAHHSSGGWHHTIEIHLSGFRVQPCHRRCYQQTHEIEQQ